MGRMRNKREKRGNGALSCRGKRKWKKKGSRKGKRGRT